MYINEKQIILASKSKRRKILLEDVGLNFIVIPSDFNEEKIPISEPENYTIALASAKAEKVALTNPNSWVIGADTIVTADKEILGKPKSRQDAFNMIKKLSGNIHTVYTGYCITSVSEKKILKGCEKTYVCSKNISENEITYYLDNGKPYDKSGGYSLLGPSSLFIKSINGSYTNVLGLPVCEIMGVLIKEKIAAPI